MKCVLCLFVAVLMLSTVAYSESEFPIESYSCFILTGGEMDEYGFGREVALDANTRNEYRFIGYFLAPGIYSAKNLNYKSYAQITVYKNEIVKVGRYEEFVQAEQEPVLVYYGEPKEISVHENEFIKIPDNDWVFFEFVSELPPE